MWPSQAAAARIYDLSNMALVLAVVAGVVATILILWMGNVKEAYLRRDLGSAQVQAEAARSETAKATETAARWEFDAAEARAEQERLRKLAGELQAKNLATEARLEKERLAHLQFERAIAPRILEQRQSAQALAPFKGMSVIIESLAEAEPWRLAGQLAWLLQQAQWNVLPGMRRSLDGAGFFDGVTVAANAGTLPADDRSTQAADTLVAVLKKHAISARPMPCENRLPPNTIVVRVGLKPPEFTVRARPGLTYGNLLYR